ncbi:MAG: prepilin-type N-terminal cleavage/methylation domain-containing protein [Planctomycetota bacterium]|jgi:prepilin-type N-terminal cleavage/methylation domain-containing protein
MKKGLSFVELLIAIAIIGILAAIIFPTFQSHSQQAKEAAAKDNLRIVRNAIEIYASRHNGVPPGYIDNDPSNQAFPIVFGNQMIKSGNYLPKRPENPFNKLDAIRVYNNNEDFPTSPYMVDTFGWLYKPATKTFKLNWPGADSAGVPYFDY